MSGGVMQRRAAVGGGEVHVGPLFHQHPEIRPIIFVAGRHDQRRLAPLVLKIGFGTGIEQQLHHSGLRELGGVVEGGVAVRVHEVELGSRLDEFCGDLLPAKAGSDHERGLRSLGDRRIDVVASAHLPECGEIA